MAAVRLPPPPNQVPIIDKQGQMPIVWWDWFQKVLNTLNVTASGNTTDVEILQAYDASENVPPRNDAALMLANPDHAAQIVQTVRDIQSRLALIDAAPQSYVRKLQNSIDALAMEITGYRGLPHTGVTAGTYGDATNSAQVAIGQDGRVTSASNVVITGTPPGGAAGGDLTGTYPNPTIKTSVALSGSPTTTTQSQSDNSTKISTTAYVDTAIANAVAGVNPAVAVKAATTQASDTSGLTYNNGVSGVGATFTGSVNTPITWDGITFTALGQRGLIKNDTQSPSGAFNGVWYITQIQTLILPPILTRALDYNQPSDINNTGAIPVISGTVNAETSWLLTTQVTTVGTDPLTYVQFSVNPINIVTSSNSSLHLNVSASAPSGPTTNDLWVDVS